MSSPVPLYVLAIAIPALAYQVAEHAFQDGSEKLGFALAFLGSALVSYCTARRFRRPVLAQTRPVSHHPSVPPPVASCVRRVEVTA